MTDGHDACKPAESAAPIDTAGIAGAGMRTGQRLALLAGASLGHGGAASVTVMTGGAGGGALAFRHARPGGRKDSR